MRALVALGMTVGAAFGFAGPRGSLRPARLAGGLRAMTAAVESGPGPAPAPAKPAEGGGVGVLLLNLGGPERSEDVEPFLYNLFADPDIIRLPAGISWLQRPLASFVSKRRAPKSRAAYDSIGGGSPLGYWTREQGKALEAAISRRLASAPEEMKKLLGAVPVKSYIAMRYWYPFTEEALDQIAEDGVSKLVILPLYPQFSVSTSGSSLRVLQEKFVSDPERWGPQRVQHTVVPYWYQRPGYVRAMQRIVAREIEAYSPQERSEGVHVLFSAHGVPRSYVDAGDPYEAQIERCVEMIAAGLPEDVQSHLSFQSRVGPIEWLRPYTDDKLRDLGAAGVKHLVAVPISFVSEHIETLEEMDMEYREVAEEAGISGWRRAPALNTDEDFVEDMASAVLEALQSPAVSVTEACAANNVELEDRSLAERYGGTADVLQSSGRGEMPTSLWAAPGQSSGIYSYRTKNLSIREDGTDDSQGPFFARIWIPRILGARLAEASVLGGILIELVGGKASSLLHLFGL